MKKLLTKDHSNSKIGSSAGSYSTLPKASVPPSKRVLRERSKRLKVNATESERVFYKRLKEIGLDFRKQLVIGLYIVDAFISNRMLIVEIDGGIHFNTEEYDTRRTEWLERLGFHVVRIANADVLSCDLSVLLQFPIVEAKVWRRAVSEAAHRRNLFVRMLAHKKQTAKKATRKPPKAWQSVPKLGKDHLPKKKKK